MIFLILLILFITLAFCYLQHVFTYWSRNGFPSVKPIIPFGNLWDVTRRKSSMGINLYDIYKSSTEPILTGIYLWYRPAILIRDADLLHDVLVTQAQSFYNRGVFNRPDLDPLSGHLLNLKGEEWKNLRNKLTPAFTTGKLKSMMPIILQEGERLKTFMKKYADSGEVFAMKHLIDRYAMNIVGSIGFGVDVDVVNDPEHTFVKLQQLVDSDDAITVYRYVANYLCPSALEFFRAHANSPKVNEFFVKLIEDSFSHREKNNVVRKDFIQLLLQLRNSGRVNADDTDWKIDPNNQNDNKEKTITIAECAAQTYLFFIAGFDTSASALTYSLYEMCRNRKIFKKLRAEIDETLARHNNEVTYESLNEMKYLEMCILESVRKYPTLPFLNRICTKEYKVPETNFTIKEGTPIIISLLGIGRDERFFTEPNKFMPERFETGSGLMNDKAFAGFGDGPRQCIGLRMGKMVAKVGLVQLVRSFEFACLDDKEIDFHNFAVTLSPLDGVEMRVIGVKE